MPLYIRTTSLINECINNKEMRAEEKVWLSWDTSSLVRLITTHTSG